MPAALVSMADVAAFRSVHYDTVRKDWSRWVIEDGFPAPVTRRPYGWNPDSLDRWAASREAANRDAVLKGAAGDDATPDPANDTAEPAARRAPPTPRVDRERDAVLSLMQGARR